MAGVRSFFFLVFLIGMLFAFSWYDKTYNPIVLREEAINPDIYMGNAKVYVKDHAQKRSIEQLELAIEAMEDILPEVDEENQVAIGNSIKDIEHVMDEMRGDSLVIEDLNKAFFKALNILTIAELRVSESYVEKDMTTEAQVALKYGMFHLKNALEFSRGNKKEFDGHLYDEIDELMNEDHVDHDELLARLEEMIAEIDAMVKE